MGMGSTKPGVMWCAGLLVAGLLLVAVDADFCFEDCRGKTDFWGCVRRCRSQLHESQLAKCVALCHGKPNFMACCNSYRYDRRAPLHLRRAGWESTTHEEEASGGAVGVLKAPAPAPCEVSCRDRPDWLDYQRCLDHCRFGVYVQRALLHLKLAGRESATHEEVLTAMVARLSDTCQDFCHNHVHYDWCLRRCRFGPHLRLAGGESEEASGGAVDVLTATAAVADVNPDICKDFCRDWPAPVHDLCLIGAYVQRAPLRLKLAGGESTTHEIEEASGRAVDVPAVEAAAAARVQHESAAGAQPMNTHPCEAYCRRQARDFPAKYKTCVRQCQSGGDPGDGGNGILARVKQERHKKHGEVHLGRGTGKIAIQ